MKTLAIISIVSLAAQIMLWGGWAIGKFLHGDDAKLIAIPAIMAGVAFIIFTALLYAEIIGDKPR